MKAYVAMYSTYDKGYTTDQLAEVFLSEEGYNKWLVEQLHHPEYQHIEKEEYSKHLRLVSDFSDDEYTIYSLQVKEIIQ